jgi:DNA-directed RNA polymerase subunit RPC12/RpoP
VIPSPRLVVAAECPTCGAPLDFGEGATTARCGHCGSRLLLTGRGRVLAFHLAPRVDEPGALAIAGALAPTVADARLYFLPYYRFTADEFRWVIPDTAGDDQEPPDLERSGLDLEERHVERNFLACAWDGLGLYSLGVRPGTLRLSLFRHESVAPFGRIVAAETAPDAALAHALRAADASRVVHRAVVGGLLSLVYHPYWVATLAGGGPERLAIIDAVGGTVATAEASPSVRDRLERREEACRDTVEFRPLVCPNCGWDLPPDGTLVVFFCLTCARAWEVSAEGLEPVPAHLVATPAPGTDVIHLPVWRVDVAARGGPATPLLVPAFRYRGLRLLVALATRLTRARPDLPFADVQDAKSIGGAHLDRADALALARVVALGVDPRHAAELEPGDGSLLWLPFEMAGGALREPRTGFALPATGLVRDAAA